MKTSMAVVHQKVPFHRNGFTLIELIISLAIIGVLLSILLPAVQQARATSRKLGCQNNLRQIGTGMHSFHDSRGHFPGSRYLTELLPYLGYKTLEEKLDRDCIIQTLEAISSNELCFKNGVTPVFACPSDPLQESVHGRATNYLINQGTGFENHDDGFLSLNYERGQSVSASDVTDGLSQTVAFSERLLYSGDEPSLHSGPFIPSHEQTLRRMAITDPYYLKSQLDEFANTCMHNATFFGGNAGFLCTWVGGGCANYDYNHILTPNSNSCYNGLSEKAIVFAAVTANSFHGTGVNSLLGDGSVHFINNSIDRRVWRALGTRKGNDAVAIDRF